MITLGTLPVALVGIVFILFYFITNIEKVPLLKKAAPMFTLIFLILGLYNLLAVGVTSVELAEYELDTADNSSLTNIRDYMGTHTAITSSIIWPLIMFFAAFGVHWVVMNAHRWLKKR